jgi:hypothetical protein
MHIILNVVQSKLGVVVLAMQYVKKHWLVRDAFHALFFFIFFFGGGGGGGGGEGGVVGEGAGGEGLGM